MQDEDPRKLSSWAATLIISLLYISIWNPFKQRIHWVHFTHSLGTLLTFIGYTTTDE